MVNVIEYSMPRNRTTIQNTVNVLVRFFFQVFRSDFEMVCIARKSGVLDFSNIKSKSRKIMSSNKLESHL